MLRFACRWNLARMYFCTASVIIFYQDIGDDDLDGDNDDDRVYDYLNEIIPSKTCTRLDQFA